MLVASQTPRPMIELRAVSREKKQVEEASNRCLWEIFMAEAGRRMNIDPDSSQRNKQCKHRVLVAPTGQMLIGGFEIVKILGFCSYTYAPMADRRRVNGPPGGTRAPVFASSLPTPDGQVPVSFERPKRLRKPDELRKICMSK